MKVAFAFAAALILCVALLGPIQARFEKPKYCVGKNGKHYLRGEHYDDKVKGTCIRYTCVRKGKKLKMAKKKVPCAVEPEPSLKTNVTALEAKLEALQNSVESILVMMTALQSTSNQLEINMTSNMAAININKEAITTNKEGLSVHDDAISSNADVISSNQAGISVNKDSCSAVQITADKLKTCLGDVTSKECPISQNGKVAVIDAIIENEDDIEALESLHDNKGCCTPTTISTITTLTTTTPAGVVGDWSSWSGCTATCGNATKTRTRSCQISPCQPFVKEETVTCHLPPCNDDGPIEKCFYEDTKITFHDLGLNRHSQDQKPDWILSDKGRTLNSLLNTRPSAGLTNLGKPSDPVSFSGRVFSTNGDDDVMGMVFGYWNETNFFVVASSREFGPTNWYVGRLHATCGQSCASEKTISDAIWSPQDHPDDITVLATGSTYWQHNEKYNFTICFNPSKLLLNVNVTLEDGVDPILQTGTISANTNDSEVDDISRQGGFIGVYVDSQADTTWDNLDCHECGLDEFGTTDWVFSPTKSTSCDTVCNQIGKTCDHEQIKTVTLDSTCSTLLKLFPGKTCELCSPSDATNTYCFPGNPSKPSSWHSNVFYHTSFSQSSYTCQTIPDSRIDSVCPCISPPQVFEKGSVFFMAGGYYDYRDIELYHPTIEDFNCSMTPPPLKSKWARHTSFYHDNSIYLCGGTNTRSTCISYNREMSDWKTHTISSLRMFRHSSVVLRNTLYLIGGRDSNSNNYNADSVSTPLPLTDTPVLTTVPNLSYKGDRQCATEVDQDNLVITGGFYGAHGGILSTVTQYNINTNTETALPSLQQPRHAHACIVVERDNKKWVIVAGGLGPLNTTEMIGWGGSSWAYLGDLNVPRVGPAIVETERGVMVIAGWNSGQSLSSVEVLDWARKEWSVTQSTINTARVYFGTAIEIPASMFNCVLEQQPLSRQGQGSSNGLILPEQTGLKLEFQLKGETGMERVKISVDDNEKEFTLKKEWEDFSYSLASIGSFTVEFLNDIGIGSLGVFIRGHKSQVTNLLPNFSANTFLGCGTTNEDEECGLIRGGTLMGKYGKYTYTIKG